MLNVLLYDQDKDYIEHLMRQLPQQGAGNFQFTACSTLEVLKDYLQGTNKWDLVLYGDEMSDLSEVETRTYRYIPLTEQFTESAEQTLFKYQRVDQFIDRLGIILGIKKSPSTKAMKRQVAIITSGEGGSGKTTFASALAKLESEYYKTLLLTFDVYSDMALMLDASEAKSMTDLFYYIKRQDLGWLKGFQNQLIGDDYLGFTVVAPFCSAADLETLTQSDLTLFFNTLLEVCEFNRVIIDMAHLTGPFMSLLFEYAQVVWAIEGNGPHSTCRNLKLMSDLEKLRRPDLLTILRVKNTSSPEPYVLKKGIQCDVLPFEPQLRASFRAKTYALGEIPYYKALRRLTEGRS